MKPSWQKFSQVALKKLGDIVDNDTAKMLQLENDELRRLLTNGLLIRDNMRAALVTVQNCVHGQMAKFQNPLPTVPLFFAPFATKLSNGADALTLAGPPILTTTLGGNQLGLTAQYQPPQGEISLLQTVSQNITSGGSQAMQWDTVRYQSGGITWSNSSNTDVKCSAAGLVHMIGKPTLLSPSGVPCTVWLQNSANVERFGEFVLPMSGAGNLFSVSCSDIIDVVANDTLRLRLAQGSGSTVATFVTGGDRPHVTARYVAPSIGYSANVLGVLWGG